MDPSKPRRDSTPPTGVPPSTFYGTSSSSKSKSKTPPALPKRPEKVGSLHTTYVAPSEPPVYEDTPFREPELVETAPVAPFDGSISTDTSWGNDASGWSKATAASWDNDKVAEDWSRPVTSNWAGQGTWSQNSAATKTAIDGRDYEEETDWWDLEARAKARRPGSGVLPTLAMERLHDEDHILLDVSPSPPVLTDKTAPEGYTGPSADEVRMAKPHANAYYCWRDHGWVIIQWKTSTVFPTLAEGYNPPTSLPDHERRKRNKRCGDGAPNKTHHFHAYEGAVDSTGLTTPYYRAKWEGGLQPSSSIVPETMASTGQEENTAEEGVLMDLYICCQCPFYCVVSHIIPAVIPRSLMDKLNDDRLRNPSGGLSGEETLMSLWETVLRCVPVTYLIRSLVDQSIIR
jgi:ubiquitin carboxyl-terminal hydrolase 25/28